MAPARLFSLALAITLTAAPTPLAAGLLGLGGTPGEALIGFTGAIDLGLLRFLGVTVLRTLDEIGVVHVSTDDLTWLLSTAAGLTGIAFVETNDATRLDGSWNGVKWASSGWDASGWDSSGWDSAGWDSAGWDSSGWDSSGWDSAGWDSSGWDASGWDSSGWDSSGWDASGWDGGAAATAMDAKFAEQWGLGAARFPDAWTIERGSGRVGICILDTGVDASHPDLRPQLLRASDGKYGASAMRNGGVVTDDVGHGTHVAGIAGAVAGNGTGIAGAAREPILNIKVMDAKGGKEADLAEGLILCAASGARVASLSLHIDKHSPTVERAVKHAQGSGLLVVAAAGNDGKATVRYPAAYAGVLAVGSVSPNAERTAFSTYGKRLDLLAPGDHITSTFPGGLYKVGSGTSQAVPFVSAAAALVWERDATLTQSEVRTLLLATARDLGTPGRDDATGWGALDAGAAVAAAVT